MIVENTIASPSAAIDDISHAQGLRDAHSIVNRHWFEYLGSVQIERAEEAGTWANIQTNAKKYHSEIA